MAALVHIYVDPSLNSNTGTGTDVDPYGDLQYALDTHTRDVTDGNQINIKAGTAEVLAAPLDFTDWGAPTAIVPTVIRGYTTTANDGGVAIIDGNGGACFSGLVNFHLRDLHIRNGGSSTLVGLVSSSVIINCKIENTSGTGLVLSGAYSTAMGCEITDCGVGISMTSTNTRAEGNYLKFGGTRNFTNAISGSASIVNVVRNIISVGTSGNGIAITSTRSVVIGNSILANGSTGHGIDLTGAGTRGQEALFFNNVVEGFSGTGGSGFNFASATSVPLRYAGNAAFGNATDYSNVGDIGIADGVDNEVLSASPFAKSGSDTFANRFAYFAPVDTGNIRGGAIQ